MEVHLFCQWPRVQWIQNPLHGPKDGVPGTVPLSRPRQTVLTRGGRSEIAAPPESRVCQQKSH